MTTESILSQFGSVTSVPINNLYTEYQVSFTIPPQYTGYNGRQLTSTKFAKDIRAQIRDQIGPHHIRTNTILVFVGSDKMGKILCHIRR